MSCGLERFQALCEAGHAVEQVRDRYPPVSAAWCILTELLQRIDVCIDALVRSAPMEDEV